MVSMEARYCRSCSSPEDMVAYRPAFAQQFAAALEGSCNVQLPNECLAAPYARQIADRATDLPRTRSPRLQRLLTLRPHLLVLCPAMLQTACLPCSAAGPFEKLPCNAFTWCAEEVRPRKHKWRRSSAVS